MCTATTAEDETDIKPLMSLSLAGAAGNHANPSRERDLQRPEGLCLYVWEPEEIFWNIEGREKMERTCTIHPAFQKTNFSSSPIYIYIRIVKQNRKKNRIGAERSPKCPIKKPSDEKERREEEMADFFNGGDLLPPLLLSWRQHKRRRRGRRRRRWVVSLSPLEKKMWSSYLLCVYCARAQSYKPSHPSGRTGDPDDEPSENDYSHGFGNARGGAVERKLSTQRCTMSLWNPIYL